MDDIPINRQVSLLDQHAILKKKAEQIKESQQDRRRREEQEILQHALAQQALMAASELAKGIKYDKPIKSGWRPSRRVRHRREPEIEIRKKYEIVAEGDEIPRICTTFLDMKLPAVIIDELNRRGITGPNPFQMQALPVLLSGRDMIGIASTGSGKTLVFELPLIMFCIEQQVKLPFIDNEGPFGLVICPSRDLAQQTFKDICGLRDAIEAATRIRLNICLCMGGISRNEQRDSMRGGCHIMVACPGRLIDNLKSKIFNLDTCRYLCLDEADRMLDNFEEDLRKIFTYFKNQRQTVFFSATMPRAIQNFAMSAMVKPITVNVSGRAGAANKRIKQKVKYVKQEVKLALLPKYIQKTAPPVIIFASRPQDVETIYENLLLRGQCVSATYGQKHQEERSQALDDFKARKTDILVATDLISKGLDIKGIKHVINYDMPAQIEDYTHRIGRTGRGNQQGLATTFITKYDDESTLLDLKALLLEAGQEVPKILDAMQSEADDGDENAGCLHCGGLGHRVGNCPKLGLNQAKQTQAIKQKDILPGASAD